MITAYPLSWPLSKPRTPKAERKRAQFGKQTKDPNRSYSTKKPLSLYEAGNRIIRELEAYTRAGKPWRVRRETIIVSTNVKVRKYDGLPYSNAKEPEDPGAAVYFELDGRPYCLPCDRWDRLADNLAAIAAHIGALRAIERWGVGETADHYAGYAALPAAGESTLPSCWEVLGIQPTKDAAAIKTAYRKQLQHRHPDKGGNTILMQEAHDAYRDALIYIDQ